MQKTRFVPINKQSKRAQREHHNKRRGSWNGVCPVTKIAKDKQAYNRAKENETTRREYRC